MMTAEFNSGGTTLGALLDRSITDSAFHHSTLKDGGCDIKARSDVLVRLTLILQLSRFIKVKHRSCHVPEMVTKQ